MAPPSGTVLKSCFLQPGWSQPVNATVDWEGGVDARETEETEEEAARVDGGGVRRGVGSEGW